MVDIASATDKRGKDHIDLVLDAELQIGNVLFRQGGEVYVGAGQVDTLARGNVAVVQTLDPQGLVVHHLDHLERQNAVVHIDKLAGGNHLGDVRVVEVPMSETTLLVLAVTRKQKNVHVLVVAGSGVLLIGRDVELRAGLDRDVLVADGVTRADLGALGVEGNGERATSLDARSLAGVVDDRLVVLGLRSILAAWSGESGTNLI